MNAIGSRGNTMRRIVRAGLATMLAVSAASVAAQEFKLGLVTFLSGGAAGPFGIPARNAGELIVDAVNAGSLPAPYNTKGIAGRAIQPIWVDEAGGPSKQVTEYRALVQRQNVDAVIGYISSGDCLAIAPVTEELLFRGILYAFIKQRGYPVLATVITADLAIAGQLAPGDWIEFRVCTRAEAMAALVEQEGVLRALG